jgi:hypothetical protein
MRVALPHERVGPKARPRRGRPPATKVITRESSTVTFSGPTTSASKEGVINELYISELKFTMSEETRRMARQLEELEELDSLSEEDSMENARAFLEKNVSSKTAKEVCWE